MRVDQILHVVQRLDSPREAERIGAETAIAGLTREEVYELLEWSKRGAAERKRENWMRGCGAALMLPLVVLLLMGSLVMLFTLLSTSAFFTGAIGLVVGHQMFLFIARIKPYAAATEAAAVSRLQDPLTVDPLLGYLFVLEPPAQEAVIGALRRLLPRMEERHRGMLFPEARASLNRIITAGGGRFTEDFVLTAVAALAKIGSASAVGPLEELSGRPARTELGRRISEEAARSLAAIRTRLEAARQADTLLRASETADNRDLVRPAAAVDVGSGVLLRPDTTVDESERRIP